MTVYRNSQLAQIIINVSVSNKKYIFTS